MPDWFIVLSSFFIVGWLISLLARLLHMIYTEFFLLLGLEIVLSAVFLPDWAAVFTVLIILTTFLFAYGKILGLRLKDGLSNLAAFLFFNLLLFLLVGMQLPEYNGHRGLDRAVPWCKTSKSSSESTSAATR